MLVESLYLLLIRILYDFYEPGNVAFSILSPVADNSIVKAINVRDLFSEYFVSPEAPVEWQRRMTRRGFQLH
jgi:hypothetical protein